MEVQIIIFFTTRNLVCSPHCTVPKVISDLLMIRFSRLLISHCPPGLFVCLFSTLATIKACFEERICLLTSNNLSNPVFWQFCLSSFLVTVNFSKARAILLSFAQFLFMTTYRVGQGMTGLA